LERGRPTSDATSSMLLERRKHDPVGGPKGKVPGKNMMRSGRVGVNVLQTNWGKGKNFKIKPKIKVLWAERE